MDVPDLTPLLEQLNVNIDNLEDALEPLLQHALSERAAALPLLDRAKLYVLVTYTIESILFSLLRLNGVNAKEHPVFRELTRVKQYFEKIKAVETSGVERQNLSLNKEAAGRIIKHALAAYNPDRVEKLPKGEAKVQAKADILARRKAADEAAAAVETEDGSSELSTWEAPYGPVAEKQTEEIPKKKRRRLEASMDLDDESPATKRRELESENAAADSRKDRKKAKRLKKDKEGQEKSKKEKRKKKKAKE